jgi:type III secretion protein Q
MENKETEKAETNLAETGEEAEEIIETANNEETGEDAEETTAALENILVNLRVEIAGDKFSLREVQKLRAGQIINLGCRPTDTVRIVTDTSDQPVALGELVDIEGQLGVRLTRIFI